MEETDAGAVDITDGSAFDWPRWLAKIRGTQTVIWNGVVVQNNTKIEGHTPYVGLPEYKPHGKGPIRLQDHNSEVSYRNIWIRDLERKSKE